jgi:hypothetical protein
LLIYLINDDYKAESRKQKAESRKQKAESRKQKAESRKLKTEWIENCGRGYKNVCFGGNGDTRKVMGLKKLAHPLLE